MKYLSLGCLLGLLLMAATCRTGGASRMQLLQKTWLHSHEEDQGDLHTYRPNTYDFPPSRGRTGFSFNEENVFVQYEIAATDGLEELPGQWQMAGKDLVQISFEADSLQDYQLEIVILEPNLLKVRRKMQE